MKVPRISIDAMMAVVGVVALDCLALRSLGLRPEALASEVRTAAFNYLPMAHLLAIGVAVLIRGGWRARPRLLAFVVGGTVALLTTRAWQDPLIEAAEAGLGGGAFEAWVDAHAEPLDVIRFALRLALSLGVQLAAALASAAVAGLFRGRIGGGVGAVASEPGRVGGRRRVASLVVLVAFVAIPALAIEVYLRRVTDPRIARLPSGCEAVVDLQRAFPPARALPAGSGLLPFDGARVRVVRDDAPCDSNSIELWATDRAGPPRVLHLRNVEVTFLDGDRAGLTTRLPHGTLRLVQ